VDALGLDSLRPGDVLVSNDPHLAGGTHVNDVNVMLPVFAEGRPVLFAQSKAHWRDVGGKDPGSWSADTRSIYQEGFRIPPLRLVREGVINAEVVELIRANGRLPKNADGDLHAQIAACRLAETRLQELLAELGWPALSEGIEAILDHGERMSRAAIREIPDGAYEGASTLDSDGVEDRQVTVRVKVRVDGDRIHADFDGSDPEAAGGASNTVLAGTVSAVRLAIKCLMDPELPTHEGAYRPITVSAPSGTCVNARPPAPVTVGFGNVTHAVVEAVWQALGQVLPDRIIAGTYGSIQGMQIAGAARGGRFFVHGQPHAGGWGARAGKDGISALMPLVNGDCSNIPVEIIESRFPLRVERYSLFEDSAGAGRFRGGLGVILDYRVLQESAVMNASLIRYRIAPAGVLGGEPGALSVTVVNPGTPGEVRHHEVSGHRLGAGDLVSHRTGGGGGYGPAFERDPEGVASDVRDGYVSAGAARSRYGVVLNESGGVDQAATSRARGAPR
jgi:N-methylhydantoinase B